MMKKTLAIMMLVFLLVSVASCGLADIKANRDMLKEYIDFLSGEWGDGNSDEYAIIDETTLGIDSTGQLIYTPNNMYVCYVVYLTQSDDLIFLNCLQDNYVIKLKRVK